MKNFYKVKSTSPNGDRHTYCFKSRLSAVNFFMEYSNTTSLEATTADSESLMQYFNNWCDETSTEILEHDKNGLLVRGEMGKWGNIILLSQYPI